MDRIKRTRKGRRELGDGLKLEEDGGDEKGLEEMDWFNRYF